MKTIAVLVLFLSFYIPQVDAFWGDDKKEEKNVKAPVKKLNREDLLQDEKNTISIYKQNVNSVVNVTNIQHARSWAFGNVEEIPRGTGSGYVWSKDGHIVTNYHVVAGGHAFVVNFKGDKKQYSAEVVGIEARKDIAVLKLKEMPKKLNPIDLGSSKNLQVGQKVLAIGNPFGLDHSISKGIVSATGRVMDGVAGLKIHDMIQTDAAINRGNSGGPLLDSSGSLIGMNTQIISPSGGSSGLGFAVPVDTIARIVPQLIQYGEVIRPGLGLNPLREDIKLRFFGKGGVVIQSIDERGAAYKAGLRGMSSDGRGRYRLGDIILEVNGIKVNDKDGLVHELDKYKVGEKVELKYLRNEKQKKVRVTLKKI
ncbi:MAG: PDZ domain-containing protein [Bacteriovoracaceae bacterium]|nr:PDZ domain-containing protein [Bacteriovoracaceae bacterium]